MRAEAFSSLSSSLGIIGHVSRPAITAAEHQMRYLVICQFEILAIFFAG
jgi:hypothetical protein